MPRTLLSIVFGLALLASTGFAREYDSNDLPSVSAADVAQAKAAVDVLVTRVTPTNVNDLIYPPAGAKQKFVALEVCRAANVGCLDERQMLAVAAVQVRNGSLLGANRANDVAFYWLDPDDQAFKDLARLCATEANSLKGPPGPPGLGVCLDLDTSFKHWSGFALVFYELTGPFKGYNTKMYGEKATEWRFLPYQLWNIREWSSREQ